MTGARESSTTLGAAVTDARSSGARAALICLAVLVVIAGVALDWLASRRSSLDYRYVHAVAYALARGANLYDDSVRGPVTQALYQSTLYGLPYPPSTGWVLLPFALVPVAVGRVLWFLLNLGVLSAGLWAMLAAFARDWRPEARLLAVGLVLCSSAARWCFLPLQSAPLVTGLLALFLAALVKGRPAAATLLAVFALCLKVTMGLPFLALAVLMRQYKLAVIALAAVIVLNLAGFARLGGREAFKDYQTNVARVEVTEPINDPDPHDPAAIMRTDWTFMLNLVAPDTPRNRLVSLALTALAGLYAAVLALRLANRTDPELLLTLVTGPAVCLTLLVVYHHHYEGLMLAVPVLLYLAAGRSVQSTARQWFVWPTALFFGLYAVQVVESAVTRRLGNTYLPLVKVSSAVVVTVALVASLGMLAHAARLLAGHRVRQTDELQRVPG